MRAPSRAVPCLAVSGELGRRRRSPSRLHLQACPVLHSDPLPPVDSQRQSDGGRVCAFSRCTAHLAGFFAARERPRVEWQMLEGACTERRWGRARNRQGKRGNEGALVVVAPNGYIIQCVSTRMPSFVPVPSGSTWKAVPAACLAAARVDERRRLLSATGEPRHCTPEGRRHRAGVLHT